MVKTTVIACTVCGLIALGSWGVQMVWNAIMPAFGFTEIALWQGFLFFIIILMISGFLRVSVTFKVSHD